MPIGMLLFSINIIFLGNKPPEIGKYCLMIGKVGDLLQINGECHAVILKF
jgi:hypothetical protein